MSDRRVRRLMESLHEPERHLEFEEMATFVEGTIGAAEREIVESHIEDCAMCRAEVEDLFGVRRRSPRFESGSFAAALQIAAIIVVVIGALFAFRRGPVMRPAVPPPIAPPQIAVPLQPVPPLPAPAPPDTLRGGESTTTAVLSPYNETITATRPTFTWSAAPNATYVVTIATENHDVLETSGRLTESRWQPSRELQPGTYVWQVKVEQKGKTTILPSPDQPPARFQLAEPSSTKPAQ